MRKYFAYGSCTNVTSFRDTMKKADCEDKFTILGVGILKDYRLAFTRKSGKWGGGVLDIVESSGDHVLGVIYEIPDKAIFVIDDRENAPVSYKRIDTIKVTLGWELVEVFTYTVTEKNINEVAPTNDYLKTVLDGMESRFSMEYIKKYLIGHCRSKFKMEIRDQPTNNLYHYNECDTITEYQRQNKEFYELLRQMSMYMGDGDEKVETIKPTPQMFRLVVKCAEIAARDRLDYGHMIPRGMQNRLAKEFERITGVVTEKLPS